jgi:hypothetical protein
VAQLQEKFYLLMTTRTCARRWGNKLMTEDFDVVPPAMARAMTAPKKVYMICDP